MDVLLFCIFSFNPADENPIEEVVTTQSENVSTIEPTEKFDSKITIFKFPFQFAMCTDGCSIIIHIFSYPSWRKPNM